MDFLIEKYATMLAMRSIAECTASDITAIEPMKSPAITFKIIKRELEITENRAAFCFFIGVIPKKFLVLILQRMHKNEVITEEVLQRKNSAAQKRSPVQKSTLEIF